MADVKVFAEDLFDQQAGLELNNRDDVEEITNYIHAFRMVRDNLRDAHGLPLSVRLICGAHRILPTGARGANKPPAELRRSQNWIGGTRPGNAVFVPPPPDHITALLTDLERYDQGSYGVWLASAEGYASLRNARRGQQRSQCEAK